MLEFYIISETQTTPEAPEDINLAFAEKLNLKTFHNLQKKGIIEDEFNYFEDFRWNANLVKSKLEELQHLTDTDVVKLKAILAPAVAISKGLIAYCD
ncbi:MAG: hypothetical protein GQ574_14130 [Crocinitomix sp.]|nr:hypothetical protein [Crocinitomix sp.]